LIFTNDFDPQIVFEGHKQVFQRRETVCELANIVIGNSVTGSFEPNWIFELQWGVFEVALF